MAAYEIAESCLLKMKESRTYMKTLKKSSDNSFLKSGNEIDDNKQNINDNEHEYSNETNVSSTEVEKTSSNNARVERIQRDKRNTNTNELQNMNGAESKQFVEDTLKDFANQVAKWRGSNRQNPNPEQFAEYLTDEFLCRRLDPLPKGKFVTVARKAISLEIEKIANLPVDNVDNKKAQRRTTKSETPNRNAFSENNALKKSVRFSNTDDSEAVSSQAGGGGAPQGSHLDRLFAKFESQQNEISSLKKGM